MRASRTRPTARAAAVAILAVATTALVPAVPAGAATTTTTTFVASTVGPVPSAAALDRSLPSDVRVTEVAPLGGGLARVTVRGTPGASTAAALAATPAIGAAAPAARTRIAGAIAPMSSPDPVFRSQWDLWDAASNARAGGYGVDAPRAWRRTLGSRSVVVAVLDTGITAQRDLRGVHRVPGYDFVTDDPTDGVGSGDGDGWDPDPTDPGDFCAGEPSSWHGTFVTGEIAGTHDAWGIAGEAPGVSVEPVRVLGRCGGSEADLIAAIEWASGGAVPGVPVNAHPAQVLSISLGAAAPNGCDAPLQHALDDAWARGSTVVAAAGNDDAPIAGTAPADCAHVVSVAATTRSADRASYSNYGTSALSPTIAAPGGDARNPVWGDLWTATGAVPADGSGSVVVGYIGTSMATPRVSAAVALLQSVQPAGRLLSPDAVRARLVRAVTPYPAGATCSTLRCGAGVLNVGDLVGAPKRFVHTGPVTISGTARAGLVLTAHAGTFRPSPTATAYRWYRNGRAVAATGSRYRLHAADRGAKITVRVTVTRSGYTAAVSTSGYRRVAR